MTHTATLQGSWFTPSVDYKVGRILRDALRAAQERDVTRPRIADLSITDRDHLSAATFAYLSSRRHSPSPYPGWLQVNSFDAGVLRWWNDHLGGPFPSRTTRQLQTLRSDIYDYLDELGRISKEPGQNSPVHVAPLNGQGSSAAEELDQRTLQVSSAGAGFGDAATNALVEAAAMRAAADHYAGWSADDVSRDKCGWDITFRRGQDERHVEVKGVSGQRPKVLLTRNEVAVARDDAAWSLLVVTRALLAPEAHEFSASEALAAAAPYVYVADLG